MAKRKAKKPEQDPRYDYVPGSPPGPMVQLTNELKQQVRIADWPQSLLDMLWTGVLKGTAHDDACRIAQQQLEGDS